MLRRLCRCILPLRHDLRILISVPCAKIAEVVIVIATEKSREITHRG
jgi:hypothetical protein